MMFVIGPPNQMGFAPHLNISCTLALLAPKVHKEKKGVSLSLSPLQKICFC